MNENRRQILEMLAAGQISADEAERLIAALEKEPAAASPADRSESGPSVWPKYLRVVVEAENHHGVEGPSRVNIRIPMQLLRAGVKLANLIPPQARGHVNDALREHGMQFDLTQLKPENLEELVEQLKDLSVDINEKNNKVRVFCE